MFQSMFQYVFRSTTRHLLAVTIAVALTAPAALAQGADPEDKRYQFNQVADGYLRLDLKTGQVSLCSRRDIGWSCVAVADDRAAFDSEIARLQGENATLKKALLDRGLPLPGGVKPEASAAPAAQPSPPVARNDNPDLKLPSDAEIDRMMAVVEKIWRRLAEVVMNLQRDVMKKQP
jgi:hypothetical protein